MGFRLKQLGLLTGISAAVLTVASGFSAGADLAEVKGLFEQQQYTEARRVLDGLPWQTTENGEASYYRGRLDLIDGDLERAAESLEKALDVDPDRSEYQYWLAFAMMRRMPYRGFLGRMMGGMELVKRLRKAVELDPENIRARMTLFQILARSYGMGGAKKEDLVRQVDAIAGVDSVMGRVARGTFYQLVEEDADRAGYEFELGFSADPHNRAAAISYADYLWESGQRDSAMKALASFVGEVPEDKTARFNLGIKTILTGQDLEGAEAVFAGCLGLKSDTGLPTEAMVRWCLGLACHLQGKEDQAAEEWSRAYQIDKDLDRLIEETPDLAVLGTLLESAKAQ
jgi:tetratricopeptide (TPR) repeat protein